MRILFYNHAGEISGAERVLLSILQHLSLPSGDSMLCAPPGLLLEAADREGARVEAVAPLVLGRTHNPLLLGGYALRAGRPAFDLARHISSFRPDLVYANSLRAGMVAVTAVRLVRARPRVVVHLHDPAHETLLDRIAARYVGRLADMLIAVSRYVADGFSREHAKVRVLHNAIDPDHFHSNPDAVRAIQGALSIPSSSPLLTVAGQITPWKGQREALEAFAAVRAAVPDARLLIAGSAKFVGRHRRYDTVAYQRELHERAERPDLAGSVHFSGEIRDIAAVYAASTIVLVPSWYEAFAMVVLEAMAAERPLIATASGGNLEIVEHEETGWLVPPKEPAALAAAAIRLLKDDALRQRIAANGSARVRERHVIGPYMAKFDEIMGR
jgi:L-malate glycosyltransferase